MQNNSKYILFLHGFTQNSLAFQKRIKVLTKSIKSKFPNYNFLFPDGPYVLDDNSLSNDEEIKRGWLYLKEDDKMHRVCFVKEPQLHYIGLNKTLEELISINESYSYNIECIFGFSQGAFIATLLSILICKGEYKKYFPNLRCIIIVSGFIDPLPINKEIDIYYEKLEKASSGEILESNDKLNIPCLSVYGLSDEYIIPEKSEKLKNIFNNIEIHVHKGKHFVPTSKEDIQIFINFLNKNLK